MSSNVSLGSVKTFIKRCYEIGNTPIWELKTLGANRPATNSPAQRKKETKRSAARDSGGYQVFSVEGLIQSGITAKYSINGEEFDINGDTWVVGVIRLGAMAKVRGTTKVGRPRIATKVVIL